MKVLVNSYSCSPNRGSEPGLGWNWCTNLAKYCELYIITEEHWRENIEAVLPSLPQSGNMHFYYNRISDKARSMAQNQGTWLFYWYYREWQKRTLSIARQICSDYSIDIVHQLNWTGYREPGYLWKINGPKYVWGPIGGTNLCPVNYIKGIDSKITATYSIKNFLNKLQFRLEGRVGKAARRSDLIFCDSNSGVESFKKVYGVDSLQINESGCYSSQRIERNAIDGKETLDILWVGRFIPTKLLNLALQSISQVKRNYNIKLHILGGGSDEEYYKELADNLGLDDRCVWHGQVDHDQVLQIMKKSDLLFYTSVVDGTPAGIMESISNGLPILCFDTCGFGPMVDESIGVKIPLTNPKQSAKEFAEKIMYLYDHRSELQVMSDNCVQKVNNISWDALAKRMVGLYDEILK